MIADLIRNDLGRVCIAGSVQVRQLMGVESYRGVHQLVSSIVGTLKPSVSPLDCLRAVFPAGSMTGAPKRRTMQLIEEVEWAPRGLYAGALGWFDVERAEFSVVIRTLQGERDRATLNVGGAIIIGSDAASEMQEAMDKARSVSTSPSLAMGLETSEVSPWCLLCRRRSLFVDSCDQPLNGLRLSGLRASLLAGARWSQHVEHPRGRRSDRGSHARLLTAFARIDRPRSSLDGRGGSGRCDSSAQRVKDDTVPRNR